MAVLDRLLSTPPHSDSVTSPSPPSRSRGTNSADGTFTRVCSGFPRRTTDPYLPIFPISDAQCSANIYLGQHRSKNRPTGAPKTHNRTSRPASTSPFPRLYPPILDSSVIPHSPLHFPPLSSMSDNDNPWHCECNCYKRRQCQDAEN